MLSFLHQSLTSRKGQQTAAYFSAQAVNALLGIAVAVILTNALGEIEWGRYSFIISVITVGSVIFDFGVHSSAQRLIAVAKSSTEERGTFATAYIAALGLGIGFAAFLGVVSLAIDSVFTNQSGSGAALLAVAPFALAYPLHTISLSLTKGSNKIVLLSVITVLPRILFIPAIYLLGTSLEIGAGLALILLLATMFIAAIVSMSALRPAFGLAKERFSKLRTEIKEYGLQMYAARVIDGLVAGFDRMMLTQFQGLAVTGYYHLAMTLSLPISMFSQSISASYFKEFATTERIPAKALFVNAGISVVGGLALVLGALVIVPMIFNDAYENTLAVLPVIAVGSVLSGLNQPYHSFLAAKRQGRAMRTMSFATSGLNIVLNVILVPLLSMIGAAVAYIATYALNLLMNLYYYNSFLKVGRTAE